MQTPSRAEIVVFDIIIINWNAGEQLHECLLSIKASFKGRFQLNRVVVVDNASIDGVVDRLDDLDLPLLIIRNSTNIGFAAACNQAARGTIADYLLFLNPDTCLFRESLVVPLEFLERPDNQNIGIVGLQLLDQEGRISRTCAKFPSPKMFVVKMFGLNRLTPLFFTNRFLGQWDNDHIHVVPYVLGAFFLVRREIFNLLDGFDERFFVYFEEVDFSYRAKKAGWKTAYLPTAKAFHRGGGTSEKVKAFRLFYSLRSRILYSYKHFGYFDATFLTLCTSTIEPLTRIIYTILHLSPRESKEVLMGYAMLWRALPKLLQGVRK